MMIAVARGEGRFGVERKMRLLVGASGLSAILLITAAGALLSGQG